MTSTSTSTPNIPYTNQHTNKFHTPSNQQAAINALQRLQNERSEPLLGSMVIPRPKNNSAWKMRKFDLQNLAKKIVPKRQVIDRRTGNPVLKDHPVKTCCHYVRSDKDVEIWKSPDTGEAYYRNVVTCKDVWVCPVCSSRITERRAREIEDALDNPEFMTCMITYTLRHSLQDSLSDTLDVLQKTIREFKSGRWYQDLKEQWGIVGTIKGLETPRSFKNGWHPHVHELVVFRLKSALSDAQAAHLEKLMVTRWMRILKKHGGSATEEIGLKVTPNAKDQYIAKFKKQPASVMWTLGREVSKSASKRVSKIGSLTPFQILELSEHDDQMKALFIEYAKTMKGKNQLVWSAGLRALLQLDENEQDGDEFGADDEIVTAIPFDHWLAVVHQKRRAELLSIAKEGTIKEVRLFINVCLYRENAKIAPAAHVLMHKNHPEYGGYN